MGKSVIEISEISVEGKTPLPDIEKALLKKELANQLNPPSDEYERDFVNSSIDG